MHTFLEKPTDYNAHVDGWLDYVRAEVEDVARLYEIPLHVNDHQLTDILPNYRATRWVEDTDILTIVDPKGYAIEYIEKRMKKNPIMRTVIGFSAIETRDALLHFFAQYQIPIVATKHMTVARILTIQLNEEERVREVMTKALLFGSTNPPASRPIST